MTVFISTLQKRDSVLKSNDPKNYISCVQIVYRTIVCNNTVRLYNETTTFLSTALIIIYKFRYTPLISYDSLSGGQILLVLSFGNRSDNADISPHIWKKSDHGNEQLTHVHLPHFYQVIMISRRHGFGSCRSSYVAAHQRRSFLYSDMLPLFRSSS